MKIIKIILGIVIFLVLGWVVLCLSSPSKLIVEKTRFINCSPDKIFEQVNDFDNWNEWSPWHMIDPNMKIEFQSENTAGLGAKYSWSSENSKVGTGTSEIVESISNKKVKTALFFGFGGMNYASFTLEPEGSGTKVTWDMDGAESSFMTRAMNMIMKGSVEDSYEKGLANLASNCE